MPEGPEIKRAADRIAKAVARKPIEEVYFAFEHLKPYEKDLARAQITSVQPRGKALLTHFNNDLAIYTHNQLYGKWEIKRARNYPETKRQLRLAIHTKSKSALLYSASDIEVLYPSDIDLHPFLSKLGPDVLDKAVTPEQVSQRLNSDRFRRRGLASLLLDQHCLCGLGNYLRSEVLFVAGVHPSFRPKDCTPAQLEILGKAAITLPRQSYETGGITNDLTRAQQMKADGYSRRVYRYWVFARQHQPCYQCGTGILKETFAGRRLYYCPTCQPQG